METLKAGGFSLTWLNGGVTNLDGGAMFGVVPKALWSKKYAVNELNQIELRTDPILIQKDGYNILVESGIGSGKLSEKQKRNFGVAEESKLIQSLIALGLTEGDIDFVLLTHMHFDHACGLTRKENDSWVSIFDKAEIITSDVEWNEVRNPNIRSANTYWKENWEAVAHQVKPFNKEREIIPGLKMVHTGGHSDGHSILIMEDEGQTLIHMADLMPTHAHSNVLWVLAYDDYPMTSIDQKQKWMTYGLSKNAWFTFYHDAVYRAVKWDESGRTIVEELERKK
ncbi:glyoxylase-like metal-dependent hydrolase (beta-lactamase superfamily II) [Peribacillus deserti]|uniref:Glyoxylase-like metal-dependent hydrolase (Beta-lactamase superfamily II) n=1 Tax=Peribacillus deserti TaxID=673318 RepID=A0ABS2QKZ4_9BACI|nr:glyoxylase-like metal-dependent hydrolase (beta-lactamase superfamily II) [Peribacillus deserti]